GRGLDRQRVHRPWPEGRGDRDRPQLAKLRRLRQGDRPRRRYVGVAGRAVDVSRIGPGRAGHDGARAEVATEALSSRPVAYAAGLAAVPRRTWAVRSPQT